MSFNRPSAPADRTTAKRDAPRLWSAGRQKPRLDLPALARVGLLISRRLGRSLLLTTTRGAENLAEVVSENTLGPRLARAGRLGRALPARDAVARVLTATGAFLTDAADLVAPPPAEPPPAHSAPPVAPLLIARRPRQSERRLAKPEAEASPPAPPAPLARQAAADDFDAPTIAAIRALIDEMRDPPPVTPSRPKPLPLPPASGRVLLTQAVPLTPPDPLPPTLRARAYRAFAALLAGMVTLAVLPVGLVKAILLHLNGDDLRDWS